MKGGSSRGAKRQLAQRRREKKALSNFALESEDAQACFDDTNPSHAEVEHLTGPI